MEAARAVYGVPHLLFRKAVQSAHKLFCPTPAVPQGLGVGRGSQCQCAKLESPWMPHDRQRVPEKILSQPFRKLGFAAENLNANCFCQRCRDCGRYLSPLRTCLHSVASTALDAFVAPFHTSHMSIFFMSAVRTSMWQVIVVTDTHVVLVHATESLQCFRDLDFV